MSAWVRRFAAIAAVVAAIEGVATVADHHWGFRTRLLDAFRVATRPDPIDETRLWSDPAAPFGRAADPGAAPLRFRTVGSWNPTGEPLDPAALPPGPRVIVLGESAAFGVGCDAEDTFAAILAAALAPQGIQVLNAGQVGADAWEVLAAGAAILQRYAPSTLVIFTGNNLWIDWVPPQQARWNPWAIRVLSTLATSRAIAALEFLAIRTALLHTPRKWRVEQLARVDGWLSQLPAGDRRRGGEFRDHAELRGSDYALQHPLLPTAEFGPAQWRAVKALYLQRFETSLQELVEQARARGVRVVLVTMPFNLRLSPAWKHPQFETYDPAHGAEVRALVHQAGERVRTGDCAGALPLIARALALDPEPPLLHYLQAQCLERAGDVEGARAAYARSREQMLGNLGSRLSINDVIRRVAARNDIPLVDAAAAFAAWGTANGDPFEEQLILDDCHPSPTGHRVIAEALAPVLRDGAASPPAPRQ
jgi:hypothetical protein